MLLNMQPFSDPTVYNSEEEADIRGFEGGLIFKELFSARAA